MEDAAHLTAEFMRRSIGVASAILGCGSFDPFSFQQDFWGASEVDVRPGDHLAAAPLSILPVNDGS
jgi:hypothetical protein